ncbi:GntR family transcriptional regulator [Pseudonocardia bannensis]|uniref:GntR family transcriptional regulator n=1 Tax=Pseudonocardia bannensis TaxID=630973 RepID=A0A848DP94_9PSEU|nr:GntR family transcriptional regulator [Pseudonocardia bannensis]NMH94558.1 GntR family transcriptional regulator [Pseudonocardia bannensis]
MAIDQNSPVPLSAQVKADIVRRISAGEYAVGEKIPSLRSLAAEYSVAELTVHAAVKELQYEGVLESASGRGTFVRSVPTTGPGAGGGDLVAAVEELRREVAELRGRVSAIEAENGGR